jgi:hypothetical protein
VKRSHALVLATTLALAASSGDGASAATSSRVAHGKIGSTLPSRGAAARIRALGSDDDGGGEDVSADADGGGRATGTARASHGTIGRALPQAGVAARIKALGLDD